jgi:hypothetical protein
MDTQSFFALDFQASLFPMKTNSLLIQHQSIALAQYIKRILSDDSADTDCSFLPQTRVHAAKAGNHLRRTVVLDPVASYFLYDLIFRNRAAFSRKYATKRRALGYQFTGNHPIAVHKAYRQFTDLVKVSRSRYKHSVSFDIASYFNSIYHHDVSHWFSSLPGITGADGNGFGRFTREINSGRSIDFLPQGIYPAKMIGSEFLRFVELSGQVKCSQSLRFMDDIYLFDNDLQVLRQDFLRIQGLLGLRALNVNPTKTVFDGHDESVKDAASAIQQEVAAIVEVAAAPSVILGSGDSIEFYDEDESVNDEPASLDNVQVEQLLSLLVNATAEEADVELILTILHEHSESITTHIPTLIAKFPNIIKQLYKLVGQIVATDVVTDQLIEVLDADDGLLEYQLFWIAVIAEDHLSDTKNFGKLILRLYEKSMGHKIASAKILEIPDQTFGLKDIRDEVLKSGTSDWLSWAAAIGTRSLKKAERNYALKYFAKGSHLNQLVAECVRNL